jgi:hypothetical protein
MTNQIVFLFGAGASKGAGHILPYDPPLGTELYGRLEERFLKEWGPGSRLGQYALGLRQNFEKTMFNEVCRWNPSINILEWQRKMALYFSSFGLDSTGEDLYSKLLSSLRDMGIIRKSIFGSLNYDCVLEQAAYELGLQVNYSCGETENNTLCILKVHGSCNFITEDIKQMRRYLTNAYSHINCGMNCLRPVDVEKALEQRFSDSNASYYPVMSLYSFGKNSLVAGPRIQEIRNTWRQCVSSASVVAIIGVSPNCEDTHIWNPIKETSAAKLFYIGSQGHFESWAQGNSNFRFLAETFKEALESLLKDLN